MQAGATATRSLSDVTLESYQRSLKRLTDNQEQVRSQYIGIPVSAVHCGALQRTPVGNFQCTILAAAHEMEAKMAAVKIRSDGLTGSQ